MKQMKRLFAVLLAVVMVLCAVPVMNVGITASATSKSKSAALEWVNTAVDDKTQYGNGQCVALIKAYYEFLGVPSQTGNAKDYATNTLPSGWSFASSPSEGDIAVNTGSLGGGYGHVVIVTSVTSSTTFVGADQNNNGRMYVGTQRWNTSSFSKYIRPNFSDSTPSDRPTVLGSYIGQVTDETFRPCLMLGDDGDIDHVEIAIWSGNSFDDLKWYGTVNNGSNTFFNDIRFDAHNADAILYTCDFYVYLDDGTDFCATTVYYNRGYNPRGWLDLCQGGVGCVNLAGWAVDDDDLNAQLEIHVYISDGDSRQFLGSLTANINRTDVGPHGFDGVLNTNLTGTRTIYVYALNVGAGNENTLLGTGTVTITPDQSNPVISNIAASQDKGSFLVSCSTSDNAGVSYTQFAVWRADQTADSAVWYSGTMMNDGGAYCQVPISDFSNHEGFYKCRIFAVDHTGNTTSETVPFDIYMGNLVTVWGVSNPDNSSAGIDINSNPVISGTKKFWFREYDLDYNYYVNVYIDNNRVLSHVGSDANGYISYNLDTTKLSDGQHKVKVELYDTKTMYSDERSFRVSNPYYSLDINGWLDGVENGAIGNYGTADVYVNGVLVANDCWDYAEFLVQGTAYEIKDIKAATGHTYNGVKSGSLKGTLNANNTVVLNFTTNSSTLKVDPNGGTWNGSTATQSFKQNYNTTKAVPVPTRSGYTFTGWTRSGTNGKLSSTTAAATYTYGASNNVTDTITATWNCNHANTKTVGAKDATCTAEGYTGDQVCTVCKQTISTGTTIAKKAHTLTTVNQKAATCTAEGYTGDQYCTTCKQTISTGTTIAKKAHTLTTVNQKDATCTAEGYTGDQYCTTCKQTISTGSTIAKKAHSITVINKKDATYDAAGYTGDEYCTVCKQTIKSGTVIPKLEKPSDPTPSNSQPSGACKWCGKDHGGAFGWLVKIIHNILAAILGARY